MHEQVPRPIRLYSSIQRFRFSFIFKKVIADESKLEFYKKQMDANEILFLFSLSFVVPFMFKHSASNLFSPLVQRAALTFLLVKKS
jgi:hypothetical protein